MKNELNFYKVDYKGIILSQVDINLLPKEYKPLIDEVSNLILENYKEEFEGLFLGGQIIRKNSKEKNINLLIILKKKIDLIWLEDFRAFLLKKYNKAIDIIFMLYSQLKEKNEYQFNLKTKYVFISGKNLLLDIKDYKIDENLLFYKKKYYNIINSLINLTRNPDFNDIKLACKLYMGHFIYMGFELCLLKEKKYSDDIYTCYKVFLKYYPQYKKYIDELYFYYENPIDDKDKLLKIIAKFPQWILINYELINSERELEALKREI